VRATVCLGLDVNRNDDLLTAIDEVRGSRGGFGPHLTEVLREPPHDALATPERASAVGHAVRGDEVCI
jgi:hypothetical protein